MRYGPQRMVQAVLIFNQARMYFGQIKLRSPFLGIEWRRAISSIERISDRGRRPTATEDRQLPSDECQWMTSRQSTWLLQIASEPLVRKPLYAEGWCDGLPLVSLLASVVLALR